MLAPLAVLMATDYYLTVYAYHTAFQWGAYLPTWAWYGMAMVLGQVLLHGKTTWVRAGRHRCWGRLRFLWFRITRCGRWVPCIRTRRADWARATWQGCCFYRNDLISTAVVVAVAFGVPVLVRRMSGVAAAEAVAGAGR